MLRYISFITALLCFVSCSGGDKAGYTLAVELDVPEQSYLYFWQEQYKKGIAVDSVLVKKGKVVFKGMGDDLTRVEIFTEAGERVIWLYVKNGDKVKLKGSTAAPYETTISGSPEQETISRFRKENHELLQEIEADDSAFYACSEDTLFLAAHRSRLDTLHRRVKDFVTANPPSYASTILIYDYLLDEYSSRTADTLLRQLPPEAKPVSLLAKSELFISGNEKKLTGKPIPYMTFRTGSDSLINTNSFRNRTTLLSVWASYDTLSRRKLQTVRRLGDKYPTAYLRLVSISLDTDKEAWNNAIRQDSLEQGLHCRLPEGWNANQIASLDIRKLPATYLINGVGYIIARDLPDSLLVVAVDSLVTKTGEDKTLNVGAKKKDSAKKPKKK